MYEQERKIIRVIGRSKKRKIEIPYGSVSDVKSTKAVIVRYTNDYPIIVKPKITRGVPCWIIKFRCDDWTYGLIQDDLIDLMNGEGST